MKIACWYSDSMWASWSLSDGVIAVLRRMGHDVLPCPVPAGKRITTSDFEKSKHLTTELMNQQDAVLICGPEHCGRWMTFLEEQGVVDWKKVKPVKLGWLHESMHRDDYTINIENLKPYVDEFFMPNPDDAEEHKATWLPIGVDAEMFTPHFMSWRENGKMADFDAGEKKYDLAFIGLMYQKRADFLAKLKPLLKGVDFAIGNVQIQDLGGIKMREQTELLAENYRQSKILLNLPSLSDVLVMKVLEAAACGTCVFTPRISEKLAEKVGLKDGVHVVYYDAKEPQKLADMLKEHLAEHEWRERIARQGCEEVHKNHRLEQRLETMLAKVATA